MPHRLLILLASFCLYSASAQAHPGGLDAQGGHVDRQTGQYHCHREPCFSIHKKQQAAEQEAAQQHRPFSRLYDRTLWPHWVDADGDCQDSRAETLIRQSQQAVTFTHADHCVVATGRWHDPYTGQWFENAGALDIDHVVPLRHAHGHGGDRWRRAKRQRFANDPDNLLAVSASANRSKGASSPDQWMPPNRAYWCAYVRRWLLIKHRYQLMITPVEQQAIGRVLRHCPTSGQ
ncbi:MAG: HNH endonuclease [Alcanivorax sp.]|nr:HNH endonuclease [Alcanivorax sp.]